MSRSEKLRLLVGKLPAGLFIGLALLGFWVLSRGMTLGSGSIIGYAEEQPHAVGPLQPGRLKEVRVTLGQAVKAGEVLALLDSRPLELKRARLQAELAQAKAQLLAEEDLQSTQLQRNQLAAMTANIDEKRARAELAELQRQVQCLQWLKSRQLIHATELEDAQRRLRTVTAELAARPTGTQRELELLGQRPRTAGEQSHRLQDRLSPYRAAVVVSETALHELEYALAEQTLRAPVDGTIGAILQWPGDALAAGAPVVTVVTARPGHLTAYAPERQSRQLQLGMPVQLRRPGLLVSALRGHIVELAPHIEEFPPRARVSATIPMWGRRAVIKLDAPATLVPGEVFRVVPR